MGKLCFAGLFSTLHIPLYAGREFTELDNGTHKVAIVNEKFARHYFGTINNVIGRHIGVGSDPGTKTDIEIVGVVGDTRYQTMHQEPPRQVFFPYLQNDWAGGMTAYVRTDLPPDQMFPLLRTAVQRLNPTLPVYLTKTEERQRNDSLAVEMLAAQLSSAFGVLATMLAAVGLYGVTAFVVARRTREIGIRMALGAISGDVVWLVMREVLLLAGAGVAVGLPAAPAVTRLVSSQLYGVTPNDPATIVLATAGITGIALLSGFLPARRRHACRSGHRYTVRVDTAIIVTYRGGNMPFTPKAFLGIAAMLLVCVPAGAQGVVMQANISLGMAKTMAEAALAACKDKGYHTAVAVVDRAGQVLVILRDEQAGPQTADMARRKAYTARTFRTTTLEFQKRTMDPAFAPQRDVADILALGGGVPVLVGKEIIGGVGSSGSSQEQDDACAKAGVAAVAQQLKPAGAGQ